MKKNILKIVVGSMLVISLTCSGTPALKITAANVKTPKLTESVKTTSKYKIIKKAYNKNKIKLEYPKISGLKNSKLEKKCNSIVENCTINTIKDYTPDDFYQITYETATQKKDMISIVLRYDILISGGKTERDMVTLNVDLAKGKIVRLSDMADVNALADKIISKTGYDVADFSGKILKGNEMKTFLDSALNYGSLQDLNTKELKKELLKELKNYDIDGSTDRNELGHSYYKDGKLHVSMYINPVEGSYCEFVFSKYKKNTASK